MEPHHPIISKLWDHGGPTKRKESMNPKNVRFCHILLQNMSSVICFKPLCCIYVIPGLYMFIIFSSLMFYPWQFLAHILYHHLFDNRYTLFSVMDLFSFILSISYFQMGIGGRNSDWTTCILSVSGFVIFLQCLILL